MATPVSAAPVSAQPVEASPSPRPPTRAQEEPECAHGQSAHPRLSLWHRLAGTDPDPELVDWRRPNPGLRGLRADVPIAALLIGMMVLAERVNGALAGETDLIYLSTDWAVVTIPVMFAVGLVLRRLLPIPAMVIGVAAFLVGQSAPYGEHLFTQVACFVLIFSAAAWSRFRALVTVMNLSVLVLFLLFGVLAALAISRYGEASDEGVVLSFVFSITINVLYVLAAMLFGANEYRRSRDADVLARRTAELRARSAALEAERRVVAEQAVRLDRVEIARELHDVVAHHVSLMGLQAAAARRSLERSPAQADAALLAVEESARGAIADLQLMLTTLRSSSDPRPAGAAGEAGEPGDPGDPAIGDRMHEGASPTPATAGHGLATVGAPSTLSIEQLSELIDGLRDVGLRVTYRVIGEPHETSQLVGFTAYRILQEALTNARKHAGNEAEVDVRLRYLGDAVELDVTNDAPRTVPGPGGGRGIVGMRERAAAVGGTLEAGRRESGVFRVLARLPIGT